MIDFMQKHYKTWDELGFVRSVRTEVIEDVIKVLKAFGKKYGDNYKPYHIVKDELIAEVNEIG